MENSPAMEDRSFEKFLTAQELSQLRKLEATIVDLEDRVAQLPPHGGVPPHVETHRVRLEQRLGKASAAREQLFVGASLIKIAKEKEESGAAEQPVRVPKAKMTMCPDLSSCLPPPPTTKFCMQRHSETLLDFLPDLALCAVSEHLKHPRDLRMFFWSLQDASRVEGAVMNQLRRYWSKNANLEMDQFTVCTEDPEGQFCHDAVFCLRCFLYGFVKCGICFAKTQIREKDLTGTDTIHVERWGCDNLIEANTGTTTTCAQLKHCPMCNHTYTDKDGKFLREMDVPCGCSERKRTSYTAHRVRGMERVIGLGGGFHTESPLANPKLGCLACTVECDSCANIGCMNHCHFLVNKFEKNADGGKSWPVCGTCQKQHCCMRRYDVLDEWDDCACPRYEAIPPDLCGSECSACFPEIGSAPTEVCPVKKAKPTVPLQKNKYATAGEIARRRTVKAKRVNQVVAPPALPEPPQQLRTRLAARARSLLNGLKNFVQGQQSKD